MPWVDDYSNYKLVGQFGQTVKAVNELTAISVEEVRPKVFVYDMGQNMVGVPQIQLSGMKPGTKICLRYADMAQDIYITRGGRETIHPRFTYHGYRFVEITGIDAPLATEAVKGIVLSSIHNFASSYETSNTLVNKLWKNITWSSSGNFLSIPNATSVWDGREIFLSSLVQRLTWLMSLNSLEDMYNLCVTYNDLTDVFPI